MYIAVNMFDPFKCMVHDSDSVTSFNSGRGRHLNPRVLAEVMYGIISLSLALAQSHTDTHTDTHSHTDTQTIVHSGC